MAVPSLIIPRTFDIFGQSSTKFCINEGSKNRPMTIKILVILKKIYNKDDYLINKYPK